MGAHGFFTANEGHVVNALVPQNISGGKTAQAFSMANYQHASILIMFGAMGGQATAILLNACTTAAGGSPVAQPYTLYKCETTNTDVLGPKVSVAATGYQPANTADIFYVIEYDADSLPAGSNYVQIQITNGANADLCAVVAVLSGARYAEDQSPTVIT